MRRILLLTAFIPASAFADQIDATSRITAVTLFPFGAQITRMVEFMAPAGTHDLRIADLPVATYAEALRIAPGQGVQLGSYAVRDTGLPSKAMTEAEAAGKAEVRRLEAALRAADAGMAAIQTQIDAAMARAEFLQKMKVEPAVDATSVATLRDIARMVGEEVQAAGTDALAAQAELAEAAAARLLLEEELAAVQAAMDARMAEGNATSVGLDVKVVTAADGAGQVVVTQFIEGASWQPVYDLRLTQGDAPSLLVDRGVLVMQETGEDWAGVALTLSTADLNAQSVPSELYPEYLRIEPEVVEEELLRQRTMAEAGAPVIVMEEGEPVVEGYGGIAGMQGETVVYTYAAPADIASGVTDLRLSLDTVALTPEVTARAVPRYDMTAFLMADVTNTGTEVLLPGRATLYRDGALIGTAQLPAIQPGEDTDVAFGAIDGLRLNRDMPRRAEGDTGFITTARRIDEVAVLEVENLTGKDWDVRLMDLVPYSEQEELEITYVAEPAVTEANVDGRRGVLAWDFAVTAGETKAVTLSHTISWPEGQELQ